MSPQKIVPALEPHEWRQRRCGAVSLSRVENEVHVVVRDPDEQLVSVSTPQELFALMALANHALPDDDPRKITEEKVRTLEAISTDMWHGHRAAEHREALAMLARTLTALLPPPSRAEHT